jgi:hypothetical protein
MKKVKGRAVEDGKGRVDEKKQRLMLRRLHTH